MRSRRISRLPFEVMEENMANIGDGFKSIFLAGIGALAYTGEKGKEIIDQLVDKGEITLDQGRALNEELRRKAGDATKGVRESALEATMKTMSPEERELFAAKAAEYAKAQNEADAAAEQARAEAAAAAAAEQAATEEAEGEPVVEAVEEIVAEVEEIVQEVEEAVAESEDEQ